MVRSPCGGIRRELGELSLEVRACSALWIPVVAQLVTRCLLVALVLVVRVIIH
jgi:hypothetical protein